MKKFVTVQPVEFRDLMRAKPAHKVDIELLTFIERYATNLARWDLLIFFGQNPTTEDDAPKIARHVGREPRAVQKELDDLVYLGILHAHANGDGVHYKLARSPATRRAVMRLARDFEAHH